MKFLNQLYSWYGKKTVISGLIIIVLIVAYGLLISGKSDSNMETPVLDETPTVKVATASKLNNPDQVSFIGEVKAISEAEIKPEQSGKITRVHVGLGQSIRAGQIIIELENANERASLIQAEGVYDLAVANSAQTDVSVSEAEIKLQDALRSIRSTNQTSFNNVNNVILGTIDVFFSQPNSTIPGLKIGGVGNTSFLNSERVAFQTILPTWRSSLDKTLNVDSELKANRESRKQTERALTMIDIFIPMLSDNRSISGYSTDQVAEFRQKLSSAQSLLTTTLNQLDSNYTALKSAQENLDRAKLSASGSKTSVSDAQIKQALGSLRTAQANFEKTILRSPISGTVNAIDAKVGMFLSPLQSIATIANNGNAEVVAYISDLERELISVGDEVQIEGDRKGTVAIIAPAIDNVTKKIEIRIASDDKSLKIGETVRVIFQASAPKTVEQISLPLTAVKFEGSNAYVFQVIDGALTKLPVTVGDVRGRFVGIEAGLDINTEFVLDVRGKAEGDIVKVVTE